MSKTPPDCTRRLPTGSKVGGLFAGPVKTCGWSEKGTADGSENCTVTKSEKTPCSKAPSAAIVGCRLRYGAPLSVTPDAFFKTTPVGKPGNARATLPPTVG